MSFIGAQPSVSSLNLAPLSADPSSPREGDIFYSDGTSRTEGPWVYQNGSWAQFSTGAAITVVNNLTLTPQSSDPGSPATGMLFYSDGTSRAAGVWVYNGSGWVQVTGVRYQEFTHKARFTVRAASTGNVTLASQVENGDSFGGVTLATSDLVLLKNQTTTTENGVYVVQASGAPVRSTSYDSASELSQARIFVSSGTNANTVWWQLNTLTNLASDAQNWSATAPTYSFTVPAGVYAIDVDFNGGGGKGGTGGSGNDSSGAGGSGASGGSGSTPQLILKVPVTPAQVLTVGLGVGGWVTAPDGTATTVTGTNVSLYAAGGLRGNSGGTGVSAGGIAVTAFAVDFDGIVAGRSGAGGEKGVNGAGTLGHVGADAGRNSYTATPAVGGSIASTAAAFGSGGGAGGSGRGAGGAGGAGSPANGSVGVDGSSASNYGAGGGGGGGGSEAASKAGGAGGDGGDGYSRISWA